MLQRKSQKTLSTSFKENDSSLSNLENTSGRINSVPYKAGADSNKYLSKSLNFNDLKPSGNSRRRKQAAPKEKKPVPKSIIKENPNKTPPKDWSETPQTPPINLQKSPAQTEKAVAYDMHFPALGAETPKPVEIAGAETPKLEATFSTEILSPGTVGMHDTSENPSIVFHFEEKSEDKPGESIQELEPERIEVTEEKVLEPEPVKIKEPEREPRIKEPEREPRIKDEKTLEYESLFPALGCEPEAPQQEYCEEEEEFDPEILSPKHIADTALDSIEQVHVVVPSLGEWEALAPKEEPVQVISEVKRPVEETTSGQDEEYITIEKQADVPTQIQMVEDPTPSKVEVHLEPEGKVQEDIEPAYEEEEEPEAFDDVFDARPISVLHYAELVPQIPLDSTAEDAEPEPPVLPKDAKSPTWEAMRDEPCLFGTEHVSTAFDTPTGVPSSKPVEVTEDFEEILASEIEQQEQAIEIVMEDKEEKFEGEEQREKQDEQLKEDETVAAEKEVVDEEVDHTGYKPIKIIGDDEEVEQLLAKREETEKKEDEVEEEFENYKTAVVQEVQEQVKRSAPPPPVVEETRQGAEEEDELKSIEEDIAAGSEEGDTEPQTIDRGSFKELDRNEPKEQAKGKGRSSLEYLPEDPSMSQSTDLTLSAQRIDIIKEDIREAEERKRNQDSLFNEIEKNLRIVQELEASKMYGAAVNVLKKSLDALDTRLVRHHDSNVKEINRLLVECNVHMSYCYNQANEFRLSIDYARTTLNLDSKNVKALYFLGSGLVRCRDHLGGYNALKEARDLVRSDDKEYMNLIDIELRKHERRLQEKQEKMEPKPVSPVIETIAVTKTPNKVTRKVNKERPSPRAGSLACFVGTAMSSGLASWFITRNYLNMSEKKSWAYSIGIGALIGGISVFVLGHTRKNTK